MAKVTITEYNNYGHTDVSLLLEPGRIVQHVTVGGVSEMLDKDTRAVAIFSEVPCLIQFLVDNEEPDPEKAWPMSEEYEIQRLIHMGTGLRVATFERD